MQQYTRQSDNWIPFIESFKTFTMMFDIISLVFTINNNMKTVMDICRLHIPVYIIFSQSSWTTYVYQRNVQRILLAQMYIWLVRTAAIFHSCK